MTKRFGGLALMRAFASLLVCGLPLVGLFAQTPPSSSVTHPTTYYLHGRIYTNDPQQPWAEAMAVRDEKILCVGTISQIMLKSFLRGSIWTWLPLTIRSILIMFPVTLLPPIL